ncbi:MULTISPECIES: hypothetical protein [unclassified Streptomyces]|uniref:hypothetical protein n=1 Tax=unclassified Streptomyces TaxID=2593676 RepID=UPI003443C95E
MAAPLSLSNRGSGAATLLSWREDTKSRSTAGTALSVAGLCVLIALAAVATAMNLSGMVRIAVIAVLVRAIAGATAVVGASAVSSIRE